MDGLRGVSRWRKLRYIWPPAPRATRHTGINSALELVRQTGNLPVPLHLRTNAPTKLMKQLGYGKDYKYAHAYQGNFGAAAVPCRTR